MKNPVRVSIAQESDGTWVVISCGEPRFAAAGATKDEALKEAVEAITYSLSVKDIVHPSKAALETRIISAPSEQRVLCPAE